MVNLWLLLADSDPEQARHWWEKAAEAGDTDAMTRLGALPEEGDVPEVWQGPIQAVIDAVALQASGDSEPADDLRVFLEGAASADGPNTAALIRFVAVLRGERNETLTEGLSGYEARAVRVLLDRLRDAGL